MRKGTSSFKSARVLGGVPCIEVSSFIKLITNTLLIRLLVSTHQEFYYGMKTDSLLQRPLFEQRNLCGQVRRE